MDIIQRTEAKVEEIRWLINKLEACCEDIQLGHLMKGKSAEKMRQRKRYYEKEMETVTGSVRVMKKDQERKRNGTGRQAG